MKVGEASFGAAEVYKTIDDIPAAQREKLAKLERHNFVTTYDPKDGLRVREVKFDHADFNRDGKKESVTVFELHSNSGGGRAVGMFNASIKDGRADKTSEGRSSPDFDADVIGDYVVMGLIDADTIPDIAIVLQNGSVAIFKGEVKSDAEPHPVP